MSPQPCIAPREEQGDCWRACIASILDLPAREVPNFAHLHAKWEDMVAAARQWLAPRGLAIFETYCSAGWETEKLLHWFSAGNPGAPFILCGQSARDPNENHAVVALGGAIVHDPSGSGIAGPCTGGGSEAGWWWLHVICVAANPWGEAAG